MRDLEKIRAWKRLWGYDDLAVRPGGKLKTMGDPSAMLRRMADEDEKTAKTKEDLARVAKLRAKADQIDALKYDPMSAPLAQSIQNRVRDRRAADASATRDQVTGAFYSVERQAELTELIFGKSKGKKNKSSHPLIEAFAMRTIADRDELKADDSHAGLRLYNPYNAAYQRGDTSGQYKADLKNLYDEKCQAHAQTKKDFARYTDQVASAQLEIQKFERQIQEAKEAPTKPGSESDVSDTEPEVIAPKTGGKKSQQKKKKSKPPKTPEQLLEIAQGKLAANQKKLDQAIEDMKLVPKDKDYPPFDSKSVFFVSSTSVVKRLDSIYGPTWKDPNPDNDPAVEFKPTYFRELVELAPGVLALIMDKADLSAKDAENFQSRLLDGTGAIPSNNDVLRAKYPDSTDLLTKGPMDAKLDNGSALTGMADSSACRMLAAIPGDHPMAQPAKAAANMVTGLRDALAKTCPGYDAESGATAALAKAPDHLKQNAVLGSALAKIDRLMDMLSTYTEDAPRFSRFFDLLADEVYLVLAITKPYKEKDFLEATKKISKKRIPVIKDLKDVSCETFMTSSGMGAMSMAIESAYALTGSTKVNVVDHPGTFGATYFEVERNVIGAESRVGTEGDKDESPTEKPPFTPPVILGTLNPSTPVKRKDEGEVWTVEKLYEHIGKVMAPIRGELRDKPAVAIIDITVEKDGSDDDQEVNKLVKLFRDDVEQGKLMFMLNKSYQKYPALGVGKTMAGGLTIIGTGDPVDKVMADATATQKAEGHMDREENQLVMHFLTHEDDIERQMLDRAAKNANFVSSFLPKEISDQAAERQTYDEGLPFVVLDDTPVTFAGKGRGSEGKKMQWIFHGMGLENRMSFAFQNSSCLGIDPGRMRLAIGVEPEGELMEKMYSTVRLAALKRPETEEEVPGKDGKEATKVKKPAPDLVTPKVLTEMASEAIAIAGKALHETVFSGLDEDTLSTPADLGAVDELRAERQKIAQLAACAQHAGTAGSGLPTDALKDYPEDPNEQDRWRNLAVQQLETHADRFTSLPFIERDENGDVVIPFEQALWLEESAINEEAKKKDYTGDKDAEIAAVYDEKHVAEVIAAQRKELDEKIQAKLAKLNTDLTKEQNDRNRQTLRDGLKTLPKDSDLRGEIEKALDKFDENSDVSKELDALAKEARAIATEAERKLAEANGVDLNGLTIGETGEWELAAEANKDITSPETRETVLAGKIRALRTGLDDKDADLRGAVCTEDMAANNGWRETTVGRLLKAGLLKPVDILRGGPDALIIKPSDTELQAKLAEIAKAPTDQMKLIAAMRTDAIQDKAHDLSTTRIPKDPAQTDLNLPDTGDNVWRRTAAQQLIKAGLLKVYNFKEPDTELDGALRKGLEQLKAQQQEQRRTDALQLIPEAERGKVSDLPAEKLDTALSKAVREAKAAWLKEAQDNLQGQLPEAEMKEFLQSIDEATEKRLKSTQGAAEKLISESGGSGVEDTRPLVDKLAELQETIARSEGKGRFDKLQQIGRLQATLQAVESGAVAADMTRMKLAELEDANSLRTKVRAGWDGPVPDDLPPEAAHLPNAVASCALMLAIGFKREPGDTETDPPADAEFNALMDPLMECGLDQVSPECRERLLVHRADAAIRGLGDDPEAGLAKLGDCIAAMPYLEGVADVVNNPELFHAIEQELAPEKAAKIVAMVTQRLDITAHIDLLEQLFAIKDKGGATEVAKAAAQEAIRRLSRFNDIYRKENRDYYLGKAADVEKAIADEKEKKAKPEAEDLETKPEAEDLPKKASVEEQPVKQEEEDVKPEASQAKEKLSDKDARARERLPPSAAPLMPRPLQGNDGTVSEPPGIPGMTYAEGGKLFERAKSLLNKNKIPHQLK